MGLREYERRRGALMASGNSRSRCRSRSGPVRARYRSARRCTQLHANARYCTVADFIPPAFDMDYTDSWALVPRVFSSFGYVPLMGGAIVLAATVIADAITKAQGAREGP